jgi:hypothetical protein
MPEIDADLANVLILGGLVLVVLLLIIVMSSVGRLRRSVDRLQADFSEAGRRATLESTDHPEAAVARTEGVRADAVSRAEPEPGAVSRAEPEPGPVATEPAPASEPITDRASEPAAEREPAPTGEPVSAHGEPAARAETLEPAAAEPAHQTRVDEPQEQPFERDGRWWFRRGAELLLYDESTGQWVPAPTTEPGPADQEGQGFWKCPSCGAVNGATATTCRMCFSARP